MINLNINILLVNLQNSVWNVPLWSWQHHEYSNNAFIRITKAVKFIYDPALNQVM